MSAKGECYENAVAESFCATLEFDLVMRRDLHTQAEARRTTFRYVEARYNRKRRYSTHGTSVRPSTKRSHRRPRSLFTYASTLGGASPEAC